MFRLWIEGGFGSERFGRLRCVVTHANLQPSVADYVLRPGDSAWRALALCVFRIEDGLITEIVTFPPDSLRAFRLPMMVDAALEMNKCH
jgi:RNA polymerase sigma-70 factor (ECF subfamily)